MSKLPAILAGGRIFDAVALPLFSIGQAVCAGIGVFATREAFAALHSGEPLYDWALFKLVASGLAAAGIEVLRRVCAERLGQSYANSLRIVLYQHLAGMNKRELDAKRLGALSLRFVGDLSAARNWFGWGLPRVISAAIVLPGAGIVLWLLDPRIALASCLLLAMSVLLMAAAAFGFEMLHRKLRSRRANIAIAMMERIAIAPVLDLLGRTEKEIKALNEKGCQLRSDAAARAWRAGFLSAIPQAGLSGAAALTLWQAGHLEITLGTIAAILSMLGILALPLRDAAVSWDHFNSWRIAKRKAQELLSRHSRMRKPGTAIRPIGINAKGVIEGQNVDLSIPAGAVGVLQGGCAGRSSSLAMVLARLDERPGLQVTYGMGASDLPRIHFIGDSPIALQGSLRRTLTLGIAPRPAGKSIHRMAQEFGLSHLLPHGRRSLKRHVAEAARNVSVADGLRFDLVRTALANPDLVIIDTARLAVDPDKSRLLRLLSDKTDSTIIFVDYQKTNNGPFHFRPLVDATQNRRDLRIAP